MFSLEILCVFAFIRKNDRSLGGLHIFKGLAISYFGGLKNNNNKNLFFSVYWTSGSTKFNVFFIVNSWIHFTPFTRSIWMVIVNKLHRFIYLTNTSVTLNIITRKTYKLAFMCTRQNRSVQMNLHTFKKRQQTMVPMWEMSCRPYKTVNEPVIHCLHSDYKTIIVAREVLILFFFLKKNTKLVQFSYLSLI